MEQPPRPRQWSFITAASGNRLRPFSYVILGINILLFTSLINGSGQDSSDLARGLGFAFNLIVWASIDAILLTVWVVTKSDKEDAETIDKKRLAALRSWAKRCAYCDELVRRVATKCRHCGANIHPEHLAKLGWKPPAGENR